MRVNVHDFSGHPFQVQLSRELAGRGHHVVHEYSAQYVTGHGRLEVGAGDPRSLAITAVEADRPIHKYDPRRRLQFELSYAKAWQRNLRDEAYDVVVACNVPLFALAAMRRYFALRRQPWVLWHQDIYSLAVSAEAARKLPTRVATPVAGRFESLERSQVRSADRVVAIGDEFVRQYERWGLRTDHVDVVPNWAPLDDIVPGRRDNAWAREHGLPEHGLRLMYAGTLGRKHNPLLLLEMLDAAKARGIDATLVVASEGVGADDLARAAGSRPDVRIVGYQPAEEFSSMLASADALIALLEPDAARFSVPSKVLSYLSAGRCIIALVPDGNPAAADVREADGFVAPPTEAGARSAAQWLESLQADPLSVTRGGNRARALAEQRFDISTIGDRFEGILEQAVLGVAVPGDEVGARRRRRSAARPAARTLEESAL